MKINKYLLFILIAAFATLPGILLRLLGIHLSPPLVALAAGTAIMGASFLLLWACDAAQSDISQSLAIAVVALIAVLPEYAVDMYFTWQAGQYPQSEYSHYAIANMTGANRLLIGIAWGVIVAIHWFRTRKSVVMEPERRLEVVFLAVATIYAFVVAVKGSLTWYDGLIFLGIYALYIALAGKRPTTEQEIEGPSEVLTALPRRERRFATMGLFLFAAFAILLNAEPFSEGLVATGKVLHINEFLLVQWLAPIASEMPEFVVAIMFALRGQASIALGSLISSKLNQWSLLVGMIPGVFAVSAGTLAYPIPMNEFQMHEILLTAAQSLLAVVLLVSLRLSLGQALLLFVLFIGQLIAPRLLAGHEGFVGMLGDYVHQMFTLLYFVAVGAIILDNPERFRGIFKGILHRPKDETSDGDVAENA